MSTLSELQDQIKEFKKQLQNQGETILLQQKALETLYDKIVEERQARSMLGQVLSKTFVVEALVEIQLKSLLEKIKAIESKIGIQSPDNV